MEQETALAEYLHSKRMRQTELAKRLKVPPAMVSQWASGRRRPGIGYAIAIEAETGIPVSYWAVHRHRASSSPRSPRRVPGSHSQSKTHRSVGEQ